MEHRWNSTKVKAKADFTCARCGSQFNIQAHDPTGEHKDWRVGVSLCGDCHSKKHPDMPHSLFILSGRSSYWRNISARELAKAIGCHNRTVIRRAKKLNIPSGIILSKQDVDRISGQKGFYKLIKLTNRDRAYITLRQRIQDKILTRLRIKMDILGEVKKIQEARGLNDTEMSKLLGYKYRTGWARIKSGVSPPNSVFVLRVWKTFPELRHLYAETTQEIPRGGVKGFLDKIVLKIKKVS